MASIISAALASAGRFIKMSFRGILHLRHDRIGSRYLVSQHGPYAIFRETVSSDTPDGSPMTLVVGFRLKLLRSNPFLHWVFQRVCILTTPFWSGFEGFRVKLWMVNPETKSYLGIYDWRGKKNADKYVSTLVRVLRPLSVKDSVCYHITSDKLEDYLLEHSSGTALRKEQSWPVGNLKREGEIWQQTK